MWYSTWNDIRRNEADGVLGAPLRELPGRIVVDLPRDDREVTVRILGPAPPGHVPCADGAEDARR